MIRDWLLVWVLGVLERDTRRARWLARVVIRWPDAARRLLNPHC